MSLIARVHNSRNLFQSNVCNLFSFAGDLVAARIIGMFVIGVRKAKVDCNFCSRQSQGMQRLDLAANFPFFFFLSVENVFPV